MAMAGPMSTGAGARFAKRRAVRGRGRWLCCSLRANKLWEDKNNKVFKELGYFSLKKKIEDAVVHAQVIASRALEVEEAIRFEQEEFMQQYNLWDDPKKSTDSLRRLFNATKIIEALKDLQYKAEEAKLITDLAEMDIINHRLFKQAYNASLDLSKFVDLYEMSKLLTGPFDKEGACVIIKAERDDLNSKIWAEKLLRMYTRWSEKHGFERMITEKIPCEDIDFGFSMIEFESENAYGYLSGEEGLHHMIRSSLDGSVVRETRSAFVDVIPIFLESTADVHIEETDLEISCTPTNEQDQSGYVLGPAVSIRHTPTDITVHYSGERSRFVNKMKALNRLKARLLVAATRQGVGVDEINKVEDTSLMEYETRRYVFRPHRSVQDMKTGLHLPNLYSVLDGDIEPLIRAHICTRQGRDPE